jgi:tetratricopeptide (TPR) repeat protein
VPSTRQQDVSALEATVERYLAAIGGASMTVRRRERANCRHLLGYLENNEALLDPATVELWLESAGLAGSDARRRRLTTVRRLMALTPGPQADNLALWIDANRPRLIGRKPKGKVVQLRPVESGADDRRQAMRYAKEGFELFDGGDLNGARALARRALKVETSCLMAHALLGRVELDEGRLDAALRQFRQALVFAGDPGERESHKGIARVLDGLGRTLCALGADEEAFEVYRRLVHAGPEWAIRISPELGRLALGMDRTGEAADWFAAGAPLDQYGAVLARLVDDDAFRAAIALCRGLLGNALVVPELLTGAERRFTDDLEADELTAMRDEARRYALLWAGIWARRPGLDASLKRLWDHPSIRTFLMRARPLARRNPASPRLAVLIHQAASAVRKSW